jgi:hypothetical protein
MLTFNQEREEDLRRREAQEPKKERARGQKVKKNDSNLIFICCLSNSFLLSQLAFSSFSLSLYVFQLGQKNTNSVCFKYSRGVTSCILCV